jgi:hypothetical protein
MAASLSCQLFCVHQRIIQRTLRAQEFKSVSSEVTWWLVGTYYGMLRDPFDVAQSTRQRRTAGLPQGIRRSATRKHLPRMVCDMSPAVGLKRLPMVGYGTLHTIKLNLRRAEDYMFRLQCLAHCLILPCQTRKLFVVMQTESYFQNSFIWPVVFGMHPTLFLQDQF